MSERSARLTHQATPWKEGFRRCVSLVTRTYAGGSRCAARLLSLVSLLGVLSLASAGMAHASVAVLLEQPYGGLGAFNPTGHSALYFDHICAATPVRLRPCEPGEPGVVISRYDGIGTLDWVAVPLLPYLYAVESPAGIPSSVDRLDVLRLRDLYRREHLESVAPDSEEGGMPRGNWYELVGSAYDRTIYGFQVSTTAAQDAEMIALFNDRANATRYNGAFRNCADFVRVTVDRLYPHAIRRNVVADFGLTTPKAVAHSLTHYAKKHPETDFQVFQIRQVPGTLPRSVGVEGATESLLKRYGVPLVILSPQATAVVLIAYLGRGRFSVPKDAPLLDLTALMRKAPAEGMSIADEGQLQPAETDFAKVFENSPAGLPPTAAGLTGGAGSPALPLAGGEALPVSFGADCLGCGRLERVP